MHKYYYQPRYISIAQREFIRLDSGDLPKHILDTSVVLQRYNEMSEAFVAEQHLVTRINYAMKSQAAPELLEDLIVHGLAHEETGSRAQFGLDAASKDEIAKALRAAAQSGFDTRRVAKRITLSNPNMQASDMDFALASGVRSFVLHNCRQLYILYDEAKARGCVCEVEILVRIPGPRTAKRTGGIKFGADLPTCLRLLREAKRMGMRPLGVAAHMGWQISTTDQMLTGLDQTCRFAKYVWAQLRSEGIYLTTLDLGGGWPSQFHGPPIPSIRTNAEIVRKTLDIYFPGESLQLILEPGNYLSASAGITLCSVINLDMVPRDTNHLRCVLNVGFFNGGLIDGHYPVSMLVDDELLPLISDVSSDKPDLSISAFGPSCDSVDIVLPKLPVNGSKQVRLMLQHMLSENMPPRRQKTDITLVLHGTGAYTSEYTVGPLNGPGFNGIYNPELIVLRRDKDVTSTLP